MINVSFMTNDILHKTIIFENACLAEFYVTNRAPSMNESSPSCNESSPYMTDSLTFVFFSGRPINWNWEYRFAINCNCNSEDAINCNCTLENAINFPGLLQILQLIVISVNMLAPLPVDPVSDHGGVFISVTGVSGRVTQYHNFHVTRVPCFQLVILW